MTQHAPRIEGHCDARFEAVRAAFEENFDEREELGAAVTVLIDGAPVVDLWGGWADAARTRAWERDTVVNVWSTTKGPTALCAHILIDRGLLDPDAPVATYWPEFAAVSRKAYSYVICCRTGPGSPGCASRTPWSSSSTGSSPRPGSRRRSPGGSPARSPATTR